MNEAAFATGRVGQSFLLDGVDDYVLVPHDSSLNPASGVITVGAWVNPTEYAPARSIVNKRENSFTGSYTLEFNHPGDATGTGISWYIYNASDGDWAGAFSNVPLPLNTWTYVAGTYDGNSLKLYFNGVEVGATVFPGSIRATNGNVEIGRNIPDNTFFKGFIDEVAIFDRALAPNEIAAIYNAGSAGGCIPRYILTISKAGNGTGTIASNPAGINCGDTCAADYDQGTPVVLTALSNTGSSFTGWSGAGCSGTETCAVTMDQAKSVTATFTLNTYTVTVNAQGNGAGAVDSNTGGVNYRYPAENTGTTSALIHGTTVVLTAAASAGSTAAWTTCTGTPAGNNTAQATCTYSSLDGTKTASAAFTLNTYTLTVTPAGTGSGTVSGNGIDCSWNGSAGSGTCSTVRNHGEAVSLTAAPAAGSIFSGWNGGTGSAAGCTGTGDCSFSLTEASGLGAPFVRINLIHLPLIIRP